VDVSSSTHSLCARFECAVLCCAVLCYVVHVGMKHLSSTWWAVETLNTRQVQPCFQALKHAIARRHDEVEDGVPVTSDSSPRLVYVSYHTLAITFFSRV